MEPVHALLRHIAGFGKLVIWVVLIAAGVTCVVAIVALNGVKARLGGRRASRAAHAREQSAA